MKYTEMKRTLTALLALFGFLILAAALSSQEENATPRPEVQPKPDLDLSAAARTYGRVYDRLSYGDRHLIQQLETNRKRQGQLTELLKAKKKERELLDERVADQFGHIRKLYPAREGNEAMTELAHEYEATRKDLENEIHTIQVDIKFAGERISAIDAQLRSIRARSIGKGFSTRKARLKPAGAGTGTGTADVNASIMADLESLHNRVVIQRIRRLANFKFLDFDPALCGRAGDFRTRLFAAMK